jgi:arylsulfatase A-like enzyme
MNLSRDALVFENCIASSSWTTPSHASLFTGLYPREHGVHQNFKDGVRIGFSETQPLAEEVNTLAEVFFNNGYYTSAIVSNGQRVSSSQNLDQGFINFDTRFNPGLLINRYPFRPLLHAFIYLTDIFIKYNKPYRSAEDINFLVSISLDKNSLSPFFMFINYMDAHAPMEPPPPFNKYFLDITPSFALKLKKIFISYLNGQSAKLSSAQKQLLHSHKKSQYDSEIAYLDDQLGKLLVQLKQKGLYDSSLIVITSDHGEILGEHNLMGHFKDLYEGAVRVPLMIKFPFSSKIGRSTNRQALTDVYSIILSTCGLSDPRNETEKISAKPVVSEIYMKKEGEHRALYDGTYKYMKYELNSNSKLYNLAIDPMETNNLAKQLPEKVLEMEELLHIWEKDHKPKYSFSPDKSVPIDQDTQAALKALGYIQ